MTRILTIVLLAFVLIASSASAGWPLVLGVWAEGPPPSERRLWQSYRGYRVWELKHVGGDTYAWAITETDARFWGEPSSRSHYTQDWQGLRYMLGQPSGWADRPEIPASFKAVSSDVVTSYTVGVETDWNDREMKAVEARPFRRFMAMLNRRIDLGNGYK